MNSETARIKVTYFLHFSYYLVLLFAIGIYYLRNKGYSVDDSFITYRYAYHLKEGYGLVFNVGENYYGTTAAGYAVILALVSGILDAIFRVNANGTSVLTIQNVSIAFSALSLGLIAALLPYIFQTGKSAERWLVCAVFAAYLFAGYPFNEVAGHETYAFLSVAFLATVLVSSAGSSRSMAVAGCLAASAATFRPDAILFAPILVLLDWGRSRLRLREYLQTRSFRLFCFGYTVIIVPWLIFLWMHFGQLIPGTMDAKRAQVAMGNWAVYNPVTLFKYLFKRSGFVIAFVIGVGFLAYGWIAIRTVARYPLLQNSYLFFIATAWLLFGVSSSCAYFLFNVTFWQWYGVPVLFSLGVVGFIGWQILLEQCKTASERLSQGNLILSYFVHISPAIIIGLIALGGLGKMITWYQSENYNAHIYAYSEIVDYLKREEPNGTIIQMFEPGSFGYRLGPKFTIVDELGLITRGVAKAYLRGDKDFAMRTYRPKYVICCWQGSFSACFNNSMGGQYELIGKFNTKFWQPHIGDGASLYRRIDGGKINKLNRLDQIQKITLGEL